MNFVLWAIRRILEKANQFPDFSRIVQVKV